MDSKLKLPGRPQQNPQQNLQQKPEPHYLVEDKDGWLYGISESQLKNRRNKVGSSARVRERLRAEIKKDLFGE